MDNFSTRQEMKRERGSWNLLLPCTVRWGRDEAREVQFQVNKMNRITNSYSTLPTPGKICINFKSRVNQPKKNNDTKLSVYALCNLPWVLTSIFTMSWMTLFSMSAVRSPQHPPISPPSWPLTSDTLLI